ncbi:hypothetical protein [Streptomyces sp. NBC_00872]|uniref:hypothetical protein n=1 Tax=Streptomyces sp. NBC_00872 TaxID=2903686 RepID=UPI00386662EA|nr:hypothetical protein OG214_12885 [Streptomyces sp. NBC_00872]
MPSGAPGAPGAPAFRPARLYARSRVLPATLAVLIGTALAAGWAAYWLQAQPRFDHTARIPVVVLAPLITAGAIGTGLYTYGDELDRTAVRPWWPRRLAHLGLLTVLAALLLALAVPGRPDEFGAPAMVRNLLGATGVTAAAAAVLGARLSWLPTTVYLSGVYLAAPGTPGGIASVWAWAMQPGPQGAAWAVAALAYGGGTALYAWRGARAEGR